jgi:superfamily II DNA or RNA helicase
MVNSVYVFRAGNCGINLTQANRVFLMEPGFNPALEQQAIGRVHRLGQKRKVEVVRLLVKDSVETRIHKFLKKKYAKPSFARNELSQNSEREEDQNATGPVGNIATEKPKSKILAEEFDILFGVNSMDMVNAASSKKSAKKCQIGGDTDMPDSSTSAGFI